MLGDKAEQDISKIPFSNSTIQRRIINLSGNIEQSVMAELKNCQFALQIDESSDISNHAQLIAFVRFIDEGSSGHRLIWWGMRRQFAMNPMLHRTILRKSITFAYV